MSASGRVYPPAVVNAVTHRYSDAYIVARAVDGAGVAIKTIGLLFGVLIAVGALAMAQEMGGGVVVAVIGIAFAGAIATVLYLLGTLASAQGQILKASLDTAVNTSQFLSDQDRARIMSLPYGAPAGTEWKCRCGQKNPSSVAACLDCGVQYGAA